MEEPRNWVAVRVRAACQAVLGPLGLALRFNRAHTGTWETQACRPAAVHLCSPAPLPHQVLTGAIFSELTPHVLSQSRSAGLLGLSASDLTPSSAAGVGTYGARGCSSQHRPHPGTPSEWLLLAGRVTSATYHFKTSGPASSATDLTSIPPAVLSLASGNRLPVDPLFAWNCSGILNGAPQLWVALVLWNWARPGDWTQSLSLTFIRRPCQLPAPVFTFQSPLFPPCAGAAGSPG